MIDYRQMNIRDPEKLLEVYTRMQRIPEVFPFMELGDDPDQFVAYMTAPDTSVYELGEMDGVVVFDGIGGGPDGDSSMGFHIHIWGRDWLAWAGRRRHAILRRLIREKMEQHGIHRVTTEIVASNALAIQMAGRLGFRRIGVLRARVEVGPGTRADTVLFDLLETDLGQRRRESHANRRRRRRIRVRPIERG